MNLEQIIRNLQDSDVAQWARLNKISTAAGLIILATGSTVGSVRTKGTATIASGNTSVTVTHGAGVTPSITAIFVTPNNNPTNDPGNWWVDTITSTQFNINCRANPGASGMIFGWTVFLL